MEDSGKLVTVFSFCPNCGHGTANDATFCGHCGRSVQGLRAIHLSCCEDYEIRGRSFGYCLKCGSRLSGTEAAHRSTGNA
jgi:hypothetical protein